MTEAIETNNATLADKPKRRNATWMTAPEVAEALACSDRTVWKWESEGVIPKAVRRGRRWTRWRRSEVEAFVADMK